MFDFKKERMKKQPRPQPKARVSTFSVIMKANKYIVIDHIHHTFDKSDSFICGLHPHALSTG